MYKWKWMVLDALGCMNNSDFERKKNRQHCARCLLFFPEITSTIK